MRRRGLSIIEIVVVVAVIGVLLAMFAGALAGSKQRRAQLACITHIRELGTLVLQYAGDYRDSFPAYVRDTPENLDTPMRRSRFAGQSIQAFASGAWSAYSGHSIDTSTLFCPSVQPAYMNALREAPFWWGDYHLSGSVLQDPASLNPVGPVAPPPPRYGLRHQRLTSVQHPPEKVGVYEGRVWHAWRGAYFPGADLTTLPYNAVRPSPRGAVWMIDGHARLHRAIESPALTRAEWGRAIYSTTPWGVRGRDLVSTP